MKYGDIVECFWSTWNFDDALFEEVAVPSLFEISTSNSDKFSSLATYLELIKIDKFAWDFYNLGYHNTHIKISKASDCIEFDD